MNIAIPSPQTPATITINRFPDSWWRHYQAKKYLKIDPAITHCLKMRKVTPVIWDYETYSSSQTSCILDEAHEHGLSSGVTFPLNSHYEQGYFSIASSRIREREELLEALAHAHLFASHLHETVRRLLTPVCNELPENMKLSQREADCLKWSSFGKTSSEISALMNISDHTVVYHINNVIKKLRAANRREAVVIALANGLILPE